MTQPFKVGIAIENFVPSDKDLQFEPILDWSVRAEELGFSSLYAWDHLFLGTRTYFPLYEALTTLAAIAARTTRIELATGVLVLPLRDPTTLAKMIVTLDHISGGRFILGTAAGWYEKEFEALGIPHNRRGKVFERNLEIVLALLTEHSVQMVAPGFSEDSPPLELRRVVTEPKSIAKPRPDVLLGGYVDAVFKRIAKHADGWLTYLYTPEDFKPAWARIREFTEAEGRDPDTLRNAAQLPLCINDDLDAARAQVREFGTSYLDLPEWSEASLDSAIIGPVDACLEQLAAQRDAGVQEVVFMPVGYDPELMERAGAEILPHIDSL